MSRCRRSLSASIQSYASAQPGVAPSEPFAEVWLPRTGKPVRTHRRTIYSEKVAAHRALSMAKLLPAVQDMPPLY